MAAEDYLPDDYPSRYGEDGEERPTYVGWKNNPYSGNIASLGLGKNMNRTCRACGAKGLHWRAKGYNTDGTTIWKLHYVNGEIHRCSLSKEQIDLSNLIDSKQKKESTTMDKNIAAILRDDAKTVQVRFIESFDLSLENKELAKLSPTPYTYVTDLELKRGDIVIVPTTNKISVAVIETVHQSLEIEPNEVIEYKWVISKLDATHYQETLKKNAAIIQVVSDSYKANIREQFRNIVLGNLSDETKQIVNKIIEGE